MLSSILKFSGNKLHMHKTKIIRITFTPEKFKKADIPRLRGYLAKKFPQYNEIHHHTKDGNFIYTYPDIQFKFINHKPTIIGFGKGHDILTELFLKVDQLEINRKMLDISEKSITIYESELGITEQPHQYKFLQPWMALNAENFETYKQSNNKDRQIFLNHLIRENLKTVSHAFDYWIPDPEEIKVDSNLKMKLSPFKGNMMVTFTGEFLINFNIPDYLGIGKQVARGYGTILRFKKKE